MFRIACLNVEKLENMNKQKKKKGKFESEKRKLILMATTQR